MVNFYLPEAKSVMVGASSEVEHDTEDDKAGDGEHFDGTEPKLSFSAMRAVSRCK
jgi:hypothetical protein